MKASVSSIDARPDIMSGEANATTMTGTISGHTIRKNSHTPSAHRAEVAVERKITENSIDAASHTPP